MWISNHTVGTSAIFNILFRWWSGTSLGHDKDRNGDRGINRFVNRRMLLQGNGDGRVMDIGISDLAVCYAGDRLDPVACRQKSAAARIIKCSDIAPGAKYTCIQQKGWGKCDAQFMYQDAYCLKTCNRCGDECVDVMPPQMQGNGACDPTQCNSKEYLSGPYCLKSCRRCSATNEE